MRHANQRSRDYRFIPETSGHALVEDALFLALVAGCMVIAAESVGLFSGDVFGDVQQTLGGDTAVAWQAKSRGNSPGMADTPIASALATPAAPRPVSPWRLIAVSCVLVVGAGTWVLRYRRRRRQTSPASAEEELPGSWNPEALFRKRQQVLRIISEDMNALFESRLTVRHLMSTRAITISPALPEDEACAIMEKENVRHLLVCRDDGVLIGIVSNRDICPDGRRRIGQAMTSDPHTVTADTLVSPAMTMLMKWQISCLPVVDGDKLLGVITTADLMIALQVTLQMLQKVAKQVSSDTADQEPKLATRIGG